MDMSLLQLPEVSWKPITYWRPFCRKDEPYTEDKIVWIWHKPREGVGFWMKEVISHIRCDDYNYLLLNSRLDKYSSCLQKGRQNECIVEVIPKYKKGKYPNGIEILNIYPEDVIFNMSNNFLKQREEYIKETIYYIKINNKVHFVKESTMTDIMEKEQPIIKEVGYCSADTLEHWTTKVSINVAFNLNTEERGPQEVLNFLNNPNRKETLEDFGFNIKPDNKNWKIYRESKITLSEYNNFYNKQRDKYEYISNDHSKGKEHTLYIPYHSIKMESINIPNKKSKEKKSTKLADKRKKRHQKSVERANYAKTCNEIGTALHIDPWLYVTTSLEDTAVKIKESQLEKYINKFQEELGDKYKGVITMTKQEYIKLCSNSQIKNYKKKVTPKTPILFTTHKDGTRKVRRNKNSNKRRGLYFDIAGQHVKVTKQHIPLPEKIDLREGEQNKFDPTNLSNENRKLIGDKYITRNSINNSKVNLAKKGKKSCIVDNEATKLIRHIGKPKPIIIRHNNVKQKDRVNKHREIIERYKSYDRRITPVSNSEKWSKDFFTILEMVNNKERYNKIIPIIKNNGHYEKWAKEFIFYLHLTKDLDKVKTPTMRSNTQATKVHIPHSNYRFEKTTKTQPHIELNFPKPYSDVVIIKHELPNKDTGKLETLITQNTYMNHQHKFYKLDEDNKPVFINGGIYVKNWMLQEEYNELTKSFSLTDLKKFDSGEMDADKWKKVANITTKEVTTIVRICDKLPKSNRKHSWKCPMLSLEESAKKRIAKMEGMNKKELLSFIDTVIIPSMNKESKIYVATVNELYQHHKEYRDKLYKLLIKYANLRTEWVKLAENITIPFK